MADWLILAANVWTLAMVFFQFWMFRKMNKELTEVWRILEFLLGRHVGAGSNGGKKNHPDQS